MKKLSLCLAACLTSLVFSVSAATSSEATLRNNDGIDLSKSQANTQAAQPKVDPKDQVEAQVQQFTRQARKQIKAAGKENSVFFYEGVARLGANKSDPLWSEYRVAAINEAVFKAKANYLKSLNSNTITEQVKDYFKASGLPEPTADDFKTGNKLEQLLDKAVAVADGKLSQELSEMGMDVNEFNAAPPSQQRTLFKEFIGTKTMRSAYGDLSGMTVAQIFEVIEGDGKGAIGVVLVLSNKKRQELQTLHDARGNVQPIPEKANPANADIYERLANMDEHLYAEYGTALWYDEKGYPVLVTFGQSGVRFVQDDDERDVEREAAMGDAEDSAWSLLAGTLNMAGDFAREATKGKQKEKKQLFELINGGVRKSETAGIETSMLNTVEESTKMRASLHDITGVNVEYRWRKTHPLTGKEMVGVVLVWHPVSIQNHEDIQAGRESSIEQNEADHGEGFSSQSINHFDAADF